MYQSLYLRLSIPCSYSDHPLCFVTFIFETWCFTESVDFSFNRIREIPFEFAKVKYHNEFLKNWFELTKMKHLDIRDNLIDSLPDNFSDVKSIFLNLQVDKTQN